MIPTSKLYRREVIESIIKSWQGIETRDVRRFSPNDCDHDSATRYKDALGVLRPSSTWRSPLGTLYRNPVIGIKRAKTRPIQLTLPETRQFERFGAELEAGASRNSRNCADLVCILAYGGFRKSDAAGIT